MAILVFYALTRVLAFMASLATLVVLVALGHPYWAILPAVLSALMGFGIMFGGDSSTDSQES